MKPLTLPQPAQLEINKLEDYYFHELKLNGNKVQVHINFDKELIDNDLLGYVHDFINHIDKFDARNKRYIYDDFEEEGEVVKSYLMDHLKPGNKNILAKLIDKNDDVTDAEIQLLNKIHLQRVILYPQDTNNFAVFDYSFGKNLTDYLIVVNTDKDGNLDYIALES